MGHVIITQERPTLSRDFYTRLWAIEFDDDKLRILTREEPTIEHKEGGTTIVRDESIDAHEHVIDNLRRHNGLPEHFIVSQKSNYEGTITYHFEWWEITVD